MNYQTSYTYDVLDNLTLVSQGSQTRTFVYDSLKRLTSAANPESGTVSYGYDNNGNLTTKTDARNITTTLIYDALNRLTSRSYNDSPQTPTVNYYYDSQTLPSGAPSFTRGYSTGRLVGLTYGSVSAGTYRGYDALGRVVRQYQQTDSVNYLTEASYNFAGSMTSETYPSVPGASDRRTVNYSMDTAGRLVSLSSSATTYAPSASVSSVAYAAHNALTSETYGNSLVHAVTYNARLQPNEIKVGTSGSPTSVLDLTYSYGTTSNNGNIQTISYSGGGLSYTQSFGYDALNRLTTSQENSGSSWSQTNGYDQYGNRWIDYGGGVHNLSVSTTTNRITTSGFSYDSAGNLTNDTVHAYTFDAENKISKVDNVSAYVYDGEGQRVRKLVGENTRFIYGIGGQLVAEFSGSTGNLTKEYIQVGGTLITIEPTAVNSNGTRYTTSDHLGSPRVVSNSSAGVVSRHDFMPFGEELGVGVGGRTAGMGFTATDGLRQKFTQKERDIETGLDYFGARYYGSSQGRFTSPDPLLSSGTPTEPASWNRYSYTLNNPLRFIDPSGLYEYEAGATNDQKKRFEAQLKAAKGVLDKISKKYGVNSDEYKNAKRGLDAYGDPNKANGVIVAFGATSSGKPGETSGGTDIGGKVKVTIDIDNIKDDGNLGTIIGHEGSHAQDRADFRNAFSAAFGSDPNDAKGSLTALVNGAMTCNASETTAYGVSSVLGEFLLKNETAPQSGGGVFVMGNKTYVQQDLSLAGTKIWDPAWAKVDVTTVRANRSAAIATGLKNDPYYSATCGNRKIIE